MKEAPNMWSEMVIAVMTTAWSKVAGLMSNLVSAFTITFTNRENYYLAWFFFENKPFFAFAIADKNGAMTENAPPLRQKFRVGRADVEKDWVQTWNKQR